MGDYVVGRSEGVVYSNNNLTYQQFNKENSLQKDKIVRLNQTSFINEMIDKIKQAKDNNEEIKKILCEVYYATQWNSKIRAEFDICYNNL